MRRGTILSAVLVILVAPLRGEERIAIKLKQAGAGESYWLDQRSEVEFQLEVTSDGKVVQNQAQKTAQRFVYRDTVLEKKAQDRRPTRLEREYERAELAVPGKTQPFAYQGRTVLIEKQEGGYRFHIKGGEELSEQDAAYLHREFNDAQPGKIDEEMLLPKGPVALNESWKIDAKRLIEVFEKSSPFGVDAGKTTAAGKLVKVYRQDGRLYGIISVRLELPLTSYTQEENKVALKEGSRAVIDATVDVCIDGTSVDGKMDIATEVRATGARTGPDGKEFVTSVTIKNRGKELRAELAR